METIGITGLYITQAWSHHDRSFPFCHRPTGAITECPKVYKTCSFTILARILLSVMLSTKLQMSEESVQQIFNFPVIKSYTWDCIQSAGNEALLEAKLQGALISSHHGARKRKYFLLRSKFVGLLHSTVNCNARSHFWNQMWGLLLVTLRHPCSLSPLTLVGASCPRTQPTGGLLHNPQQAVDVLLHLSQPPFCLLLTLTSILQHISRTCWTSTVLIRPASTAVLVHTVSSNISKLPLYHLPEHV